MENQTGSEKGTLTTPSAVIIGSVIIALSIIFVNTYSKGGFSRPEKNDGGKATGGLNAENIAIAPITENDHFYGNPKAKVVMVEYSDTECPFCKRFHPVAKKVVDESRGEVAWVYRHFPLDNLHSKARKEAEATECAAELGGNDKFWEYINALFEATPSNDGLDPAELPKLAAKVDLDVAKFNACLGNGKYKDRIEANYQDGLKVGISGTPTTIFVNVKGEKDIMVGSQTADTVKAKINKLKQ